MGTKNKQEKEEAKKKLTGLRHFSTLEALKTFDFRNLMYNYYKAFEPLNQESSKYEDLLTDSVKMIGKKDPLEKWYLYKTLGVGDDYKGCGDPFDCDNYNGTCQLSAEIYKTLWSEDVLSFCTKKAEDGPAGETMNSVLTTLGKLTRKKTIEQWKSEYGRDPKCFKRISKEHPKAKRFVAVCHTIGNFTVLPTGCNGPRGIGPVSDYWDLTLYRIYQWYKDNDELLRILKKFPNNRELSNLFQSGGIALFPEWLFTFGSWDNFVKANYMQDFVYTLNGKIVSPEDNDGPFGRPRELWKGHFSGEVLPDIPQCEKFFENAAEWIQKRSERMVKALKEKLQPPQQ